MPVYVDLAAVGIIGSVFLFRWALAGGPRTSAATKANLGPAFESRRLQDDPLRQRLLARFGRVPMLRSTDELSRRIARAGLSWRATDVQLFKITAVLVATVLGLLLWVATRSATVLLLFAFAGVIAVILPEARISSRGDERQRLLELQLPDILDRLTVSMEAGLGFDSALAHVVTEKQGPGYDEFRRVLQDLQLGVPRDVALTSLSERTTVRDLRIVVSAILQSGKYGLPLAEVLRVQTAELRDKRWTRAQEIAMKIPVKILLPLIFCILPTLFLVIIGPAFFRISKIF